MPDIFSPETRSRMMSGIRSKNTSPELFLRYALHRMGFRYRLHVNSLPGKPDMVFPIRRAVIFVHGCFWHGHNCHLFKWPSSHADFWRKKIESNRKHDIMISAELNRAGWRVLTVWECAVKGKYRLAKGRVLDMAANWLSEGQDNMDLTGVDSVYIN
ncbi:MAG: very short patch repair endonuclease [Zoogloeaceae bacterium]|jgi:DNA mismatch endonuclease (patch repair protein)|nr:very short patch repair endonuclease [Zoogloeaceae bacterium]